MNRIEELRKKLEYEYLRSRYEQVDYNYIEQLEKELEELINQPEEAIQETYEEETQETNEYDIIIPTHKDITSGLSCGEFSFLTKVISISNFNDFNSRNGADMEAFIYDNVLKPRLEELKEQGVKIPSRNTLRKYMRAFEKITIDGDKFHLMNVINTPHGIAYQFRQSYQGKYFITISSPMLRQLMEGTNDKVIKLYCVIARKLQIKNEYIKFTREYLCKGVGIEPNEYNMQYISRQLTVLSRLGFIKIKHDWVKVQTEEGYEMHQVIYIRLATYQEWKDKK